MGASPHRREEVMRRRRTTPNESHPFRDCQRNLRVRDVPWLPVRRLGRDGVKKANTQLSIIYTSDVWGEQVNV